MNKKRILYITFVAYLLLVFIPVNIMIYFPSLFPFTLPFVESTPKVEEELVLTEIPVATSLTPESASLFGSLTATVPTVTVEEARLSGVLLGLFDKCVLEDCSSVSIYRDITGKSDVSDEYTMMDGAKAHCVEKTRNGVDMTKVAVNYEIEDDMFTDIPSSNVIEVLSTYATKSPVQYELSNDRISWISIYLDDCNAFN